MSHLPPLVAVVASLLILVCVPSMGRPVHAQTTAPAPSTGDAPTGSGSPPAEPASPPPAPAFVPPPLPAPSQSRLPQAFEEPVFLPATATYALNSGFSLTEEYTDNFTLGGQGRTENFRTTLGAHFTLLINRPLTKGTLTSSVGFSLDSATGAGHYQIFPSLAGSVRHTFSPRLALTLTDTFVRSDEAAQGDVGGLRRQRATFVQNSFGASVDWLIDLIATQSYYRNSIFLGTNDTVGHILGFNASTPLGPLMNLRGGYEFTRRETTAGSGALGSGQSTTNPGAATSTGTGAPDTTSTGHRILGSLSRRVGAWTTVGLSSSYSVLDTERQPGTSDQTRILNVSFVSSYATPAGLSLSGSLGYSILDRDSLAEPIATMTSSTIAAYRWAYATLSLGVFQDFRQTGDEGEDFGTVTTRRVVANFSYQVTPFISTTANGSYARNEPTGDPNNANGQASNNASGQASNNANQQASTTLSFGAGATWHALSWLRVSLSYMHTRRSTDNKRSLTTGGGGGQGQSTSQNADVIENRALLSLSASF